MFTWLNKKWFQIRHYRYLKFKKMKLKKYSSYHKTFDHFYFVEKISILEMRSVLDEIITNKNLLKRLPKPIREYRDCGQLQDDIYNYVKRYQHVKSKIDDENFPKYFKRAIKKIDPNLNIFIEVYYQNRYMIDFLYAEFKSYIKLLNFFKDNGLDLTDDRLEILKQKIEIIKNFKDCTILHIDLEKFLLIVEVANFEMMNKVGSSAWCISNEKDSWKEYVKKRKQIIVWNFSLLDTHPRHIVGITFNDKKKEIIHAFDNDNEKIKTGKVYKYIVAAYGTKIHHK